MRKFLFGLLAMFFLLGTSAGAVAAQDDDATPADEDAPAETGDANPRDPETGDAITYYGESGDALATFTVTDVIDEWDGYGEYSEPERGYKYIAIVVEVENLSERSTFTVSEYAFGVQDALGTYWGTAYVSLDDEPEPPMLDSNLDLEGGATEEFTVVFAVYDDVDLNNLYYSESGVLLTLVNLSDL